MPSQTITRPVTVYSFFNFGALSLLFLPHRSLFSRALSLSRSFSHAQTHSLSSNEHNSIQFPPLNVRYFVLVTRHTEGWAKSVAGWSNMWQRFKKMKLPNKPKGWPRDERDMVQWQQTHYNITRNLAEKHGVRFFELALEHSGTEIVDFVDWLQLPPSFVSVLLCVNRMRPALPICFL